MKLKIRHWEEWPGIDVADVADVAEARRFLASLPEGVCGDEEFQPKECEIQFVLDHESGEAYLDAYWGHDA